jgi:hypothetical protein
LFDFLKKAAKGRVSVFNMLLVFLHKKTAGADYFCGELTPAISCKSNQASTPVPYAPDLATAQPSSNLSMKFSVSSSELLKQVQIASGALGSNPVLPILENFLFKVANKKLTISATDLETSISTTIEVLADDDFTVAVPAKILLETLKALPQQPVTYQCERGQFRH